MPEKSWRLDCIQDVDSFNTLARLCIPMSRICVDIFQFWNERCGLLSSS